MSVVVAIKKDGVIFIGADSQTTRGKTKLTLTNKNNFKIWKVNGAENCLMAHVGVLRDACLVRTIDNLVRDIDVFRDYIDYQYVIERIVPMIVDRLVEFKFIKSSDKFDGFESSFLFAFKDKLFLINYDCSVVEIDDFVAIGSGESEAFGSLLTTQDEEDVYSRIEKAILASSNHDIYVQFPIVISNTDTTEFNVISQPGDGKEMVK